MADRRTLDELKEAGAGLPAPENVVALYRQAFEEFGARALWSSRPAANPTAADALAITRSLRVEGDRNARRLAEPIEAACRAALQLAGAEGVNRMLAFAKMTNWWESPGQASEKPSLFRSRVLYQQRRRKADTAINGHRNTSFGPGGGTRRLHPSPSFSEGSGGGEIGSTGDLKGDLSLGMIPPSSGQPYSC